MMIVIVYVGHEDASYHAVEWRCLYCICERYAAGAGTIGGEVRFIIWGQIQIPWLGVMSTLALG